MKKILFIDHEAGHGGSTISLGYLVRGFIDAGYFVYVSTPKKSDLSEFFRRIGAEVIPCNPFGMHTLALDLHFTNKTRVLTFFGLKTLYKNILKLVIGIWVYARTISSIEPDIVYVNEYVTIQASIAAKLLRKVVVLHIRSRFLTGQLGIRKYLIKKTITCFSDHIFAITDSEAKQLGKTRHSQVSVIGEFLDSANFENNIEKEAVKSEYGFPSDKKLVLTLGGILDIKGTYDFLRAAEKVISLRKDVCFIIAGKDYSKENPSYHSACREMIERNELKEKIFYVGTVTYPADILSVSDILVSAIVESHFSRPVIEAWAQKKPVIVTNTEHGLELVSDRVNGLIVPVHGIDAMADAINSLLNDKEYADKLALEGFKKAETEFNADVNCKKIVDCCEIAVNRK